MGKDAKVCSAIVTYNPDSELFGRVLDALTSQVERIYIYDNASKNIAELKELIAFNDKVELIESAGNDGISKALNTACRAAAESGYEWILTLDHDTVICDGFIDGCLELTEEERVAVICPRVRYHNLDVKEKGDVEDRYTEVPACMTSGSFMSLSAWADVGGFDEKMVIDWVDNDICTNFRIHGYRILRNNGIFMEHKLGDVKKRRFLFWKLNDFQYSAFRIYHIVRNGIYYVRKYGKKINRFKTKLINLWNICKFFILYFNDKEKRKSIKRGIKDGYKMEVT